MWSLETLLWEIQVRFVREEKALKIPHLLVYTRDIDSERGRRVCPWTFRKLGDESEMNQGLSPPRLVFFSERWLLLPVIHYFSDLFIQMLIRHLCSDTPLRQFEHSTPKTKLLITILCLPKHPLLSSISTLPFPHNPSSFCQISLLLFCSSYLLLCNKYLKIVA